MCDVGSDMLDNVPASPVRTPLRRLYYNRDWEEDIFRMLSVFIITYIASPLKVVAYKYTDYTVL